MDTDVALNVFTATLDPSIVDAMKETSPALYEALKNGITHTYNISLLQDGQETQPDGKVTVYIPIPEDMRILTYAGQVKIYRSEENGTMTEMDVTIQDGCFVFTTDHFSLYTLVGYEAEEKPDDSTEPDVDPSQPTTPETKPTEKDEPSDSKDDTDEPSNNGGIVWVIAAVVVVLAGGVAVLIVLKKKK